VEGFAGSPKALSIHVGLNKMLIIPLCSSSGGNAVFAGSRSAGVLIDVGCSFRQLRLLLVSCGIDLGAVKAVLITHEHTDHIKGLQQIVKHTDIPVYASRGTLCHLPLSANMRELSELGTVPAGFSVKAFRTPHDGEESVGYVLDDGERKTAYCTDLGCITDEVRRNMLGADIAFIESNYEPEMLRNNYNYPPYIKRRISSNTGHLSNPDCGVFLTELVRRGTTRFILGHLSRENNTPALARENAVRYLSECGAVHGQDYTLEVAPAVNEGKVIAV
jgi:phosphoribosyl 1,2-cyclic phosphodiesterase